MNDVTFTACEFGSAIVPYMYGELPGAEVQAFESHLVDCSACTDEFAGISLARYEVYDWKKLEFDSLATPVIEIPYPGIQSAPTLVEKLRAAFSGWATPAAAFSAVAIVAGFVGILVMNNGSDIAPDISSVDQRSNVNPRDPVTVGASVLPGVQPSLREEPHVVADRSAKVESTRPSRSERRRPVAPVATQPRKQVISARVVAKAEPRRLPTLNGDVDSEDTSLRLAELLDELDESDLNN